MEDIKLIPIDEALEQLGKEIKICEDDIRLFELKNCIKSRGQLLRAKKKGFKYVDESYQPIRVE